MSILQNLDKYYEIFNNEIIKKEIERILEGYSFYYCVRTKNNAKLYFKDKLSNIALLEVNNDKIVVFKKIDGKVEKIELSNNGITFRELEQREKGFIYKKVDEKIRECEIEEIDEECYTLKNEDILNRDLLDTFSLLIKLECNSELLEQSCYYTSFSAINNNHKENFLDTKVLVNGKDVSLIYDYIHGKNRTKRIYDLFNGIINKDNERDVDLINLRLLPTDAFFLRSVFGISDDEESLIGKSTISFSQNYRNYIKNILFNKYGYIWDEIFDRENILSGITHHMSVSIRMKQYVEKLLNIPYSEFEKLNNLEQQKLIREKKKAIS